MDIFNAYFQNLIFTKVDSKEGFAIYGAGIASGLAGGVKRYVLLFVPESQAYKRQARIYELSWQNLQTRSLSGSYRLKSQTWTLPRNVPDVLFEIKERTKTHSLYVSTHIPFELVLLHNPKKKTIYQYNSKIMLSGAVEIFNTVFNFVNPNKSEIPSANYTCTDIDCSFELV